MRQALVYRKNLLAGTLTEDEGERSDFLLAASKMGIDEKAINQMISVFQKAMPKWEVLINESFLSEELKGQYLGLVKERLQKIQSL